MDRCTLHNSRVWWRFPGGSGTYAICLFGVSIHHCGGRREQSLEGCFRDREPLAYTDCRLHESDEEIIFVKAERTCKSEESPGHPDACMLNKRGWVFQERVLSPRTVYFGSHHLHWECRESLLCENYPEFEHGSLIDHSQDQSPLKSIYHELISMSGGQREKAMSRFQGLWRRVLPPYRSTNLSHEDDCLSAIAGIVTFAQDLLGMHAAFGLWKDFLLDELCWFARYSAEENVMHTQFDYVPTWSWMQISRLDAISIENARTLPSQIE